MYDVMLVVTTWHDRHCIMPANAD